MLGLFPTPLVMSRKPACKSTQSTSNKSQRKPLKTLKLTRRDSNDVEPPTKKHRAGFTVRPRSSSTLIVLPYPPQLSNPPVFDLTRGDITSSGSQGSAGSSRLAKPVSQSQRPSVDVKGKNKDTSNLGDDGDDSLWVDKYEPTSEVRRVPSLCL